MVCLLTSQVNAVTHGLICQSVQVPLTEDRHHHLSYSQIKQRPRMDHQFLLLVLLYKKPRKFIIQFKLTAHITYLQHMVHFLMPQANVVMTS